MTLEELKNLKITISQSITTSVKEILDDALIEDFINKYRGKIDGDKNTMEALKAYCFINLDLEEILDYMSDIKVKIEK